MASTERMSLARALQYQKRLIGDIVDAKSSLQAKSSFNFVSSLGKEDIDEKHKNLETAYNTAKTRYDNLVAALVDLKVKIYNANCGGQISRIFEMAELKTEAIQMRSVSTVSGTAYDNMQHHQGMRYGYGKDSTSEIEKNFRYWSYYNEETKKQNIRRIQDRILKLQDEIDAFNHTTTIDVIKVD